MEDNAGDRWFYSELLRSRGYDVRSCETGEEAWSAFLADAPPLVLVDLMLPGIDGFELCRRIRAHPRGRAPVILAVRPLGHDGAGHACLRPYFTLRTDSDEPAKGGE